MSELPVIKGIHSVGGKDGVKAWMDLEYREELKFLKVKNSKDIFSLSSSNLNRKLFRYLGDIIPLLRKKSITLPKELEESARKRAKEILEFIRNI